MDLSFPRPVADGDATLSAADRALLVVARAQASATAKVQATIDDRAAPGTIESLLAPASGAFDGAMAARLMAWSEA